MPDDLEPLVASLRRWTKGHDPHVRAAVELLIEDGRWLRRQDFTSACLVRDPAETWVNWRKAAEFTGSHRSSASMTEMAVLEVAVAIGSNRYKLSYMNDDQAAAIVKAFALALEAVPGA
jgi:hypothetical protein